MKRKQLRQRLSQVRELLASNQLSPQTREAVRQKLARERAVRVRTVRPAGRLTTVLLMTASDTL